MAKLIGFSILVIAALILINKERVADYKRKIIETVNPAAKEKRFIAELETSLKELDSLLSGKISGQTGEEGISVKTKTALNNAKKALEELQEASHQNDLGANLSNLIQKFVPLGSEPSPTWLPPGQECVNIKASP